jgi:hypothetical protein
MIKRANATLPWTLNGTHVTATGSNAVPILSRTNMSGFSEFGVGGDSTINSLPVTLMSFDALADGGNVLLRWITASEINTEGFELERSADERTFSLLSFVNSKGNATGVSTYNFTDEKVFGKTGATDLYYRLKVLDLDGSFAYSPVKKVSQNLREKNAVIVQPNPFVGAFMLNIQSSDLSTAQLQISDYTGKTIIEKQFNISTGINLININDLNNQAAGVYFLRLNMGNEAQTIKLVKTQ